MNTSEWLGQFSLVKADAHRVRFVHLPGWWSGKGDERTTAVGKGQPPKCASPRGGTVVLPVPPIERSIPERP